VDRQTARRQVLYRPTASFDDKQRWSKSYTTLQRACTAIARKLAQEWTTRNERRRASYGLTKEDS